MRRGRAFPEGLVCVLTCSTCTQTHITHKPKSAAVWTLTHVRGWASWSSWEAAWALCLVARSACSSGDGGGGGGPALRTTRTEELEREQESISAIGFLWKIIADVCTASTAKTCRKWLHVKLRDAGRSKFGDEIKKQRPDWQNHEQCWSVFCQIIQCTVAGSHTLAVKHIFCCVCALALTWCWMWGQRSKIKTRKLMYLTFTLIEGFLPHINLFLIVVCICSIMCLARSAALSSSVQIKHSDSTNQAALLDILKASFYHMNSSSPSIHK